MQIGPYRLSAVETGDFALDGGAMFGVVPRTLWERQIPPDGRNRIPLALRTLLIEGDGRRILVDTGIGRSWSDREAELYAIDHGRTDIQRGLDQHGLTPEDITDVVLTHLHFDHAGGATRRDGSAWAPTFSHARYYVQRRNLEWAQRPTEKDRASYRPEHVQPLLDAGCLELLDGPVELFPGVHMRLSEGHTTGLQMPIVTDGSRTLIYPADLVPTAAHVPVPWVMAYDLRPLVSMEEKKALYARAVPEGWVLFYEHDPRMAASTVVDTPKGPAAGEPVALGREQPA